jgi:CubicO group peptidase (beta-lactamase class C family)
MSSKSFLGLCLAALMVITPQAHATEFKSFESLKSEFIKRGFSGTVIAKKKGDVLFEEAFGLAEPTGHRANTLDTRFGVGSATKQVTAAAILILSERGLFKLDSTLHQLLPEYAFPWAEKVTVHQLLTHTSGIFNYTNTPNLFAIINKLGRNAKADDLVSLFKDKPLDFEPGSSWSYSNSGYLLAGIIIAKFSGKSYANFIRTELFEKLGMTKSAYEPWDWNGDNALPMGFDRDYNPTAMSKMPLIFADAAGGVMSTVRDWSLWLDWLHKGGSILNDESLALMKTSHVVIPGGTDSYGYGLFIGKEFGRAMIGHPGDMPGFHFKDMDFIDDDVQIIVASNQDPSAVRTQMATALAGLILEGKAELPDLKLDNSVPEDTLKSYAGHYTWSEMSNDGKLDTLQAEVFVDNARLYIRIKDQMELWLIPQGASHFIIKNVARVEFLESGDLILDQGRRYKYVRTPTH